MLLGSIIVFVCALLTAFVIVENPLRLAVKIVKLTMIHRPKKERANGDEKHQRDRK
tara:strand:+ start:9353 stop:9520 length:168 start_codon:yes stop_codon:yes gene_type:complete